MPSDSLLARAVVYIFTMTKDERRDNNLIERYDGGLGQFYRGL